MVKQLEGMIIRYARWVINNRWFVVLAAVFAVGLAGSGASKLGFSTNYRIFFSNENPQLNSFEDLQDIYTKSDNILFVLVPKDKTVFDKDTLAAAETLATGAWQLPYSIRVDSVGNFQHTQAEGDDLTVGDLVEDASSLTSQEIAKAKQTALAEPFLNGQLIRDIADVTGVNVTLQFQSDDPADVVKTVTAARRLARKVERAHPGHEIKMTGLTMLNNAFAENAQKDMQTLIPLMYGMILLFAVITLRSVTATIATLLVIMFSAATGMGFAGWAGIPITPPSSMAPTMIMTLAVADSIHILLTLLGEMRRGRSKEEAIIESLRVNFGPVFLTSLTTAIGFLSMNFSDAPPFWHLGNITAVGVTAAWAYSVTLLPAIISILPLRAGSGTAARTAAPLSKLAEFVIARRKGLLWGMSAAAIGLSLFLTRNEFDDRFLHYFDKEITFRADSDFVSEHLTGVYQLQFSLGSGEPGGIQNPEYLAKVEEFKLWLEADPMILHVNSFTDVMKKVNRSMHGDDPEAYALPKTRELAAQYLLLYEMSLPYGFDLNNQIDVEKSATRLTATVVDVSAKEMRALAAKSEAWLRGNSPEHMHATATSAAVMFSHISKRNIKGAMTGAFLALLVISAILALTLQSLRVGAVSLVPNLLPAAAAFGVWGLAGGRVNMSLAMVSGMTIGIVVDDTVHFLSKYLRARREQGKSPADAVRATFETVGPALVGTSAILVAGFLVLAQSPFDMNASMAQLTAITIVIALVADFLLLPPLLMKFEEIWNRKDNRMKKNKNGLSTAAAAVILAFAAPVWAKTSAPAKAELTPEEKKGLEIAREADRRDQGFSDFTADSLMILKNRHGQTSTRHTRVRTLEVLGSGDKTLVIFDKPRDVKDTKFLTHSKITGSDDQWLFLPALRRVKRISANNKSGPFMGSEFSYEDISSQEVEEYTYKWLRDEELNDQKTFVIERYPVDKKSGYTKLVTWIDQEHYRVQKVEFYDRKKEILKTLKFEGYRQYLGKHWRPDLMQVVNHQTGKSTDLTWSNYKFKNGLTARDFDRNALKRAR